MLSQDNLQAMINGMAMNEQRNRAESQMTLGGLITALEAMQEDALIDGITAPHSYRGYYVDLSFERAEGKITRDEALAVAKSAMGEVFEGYKGGDYVMGRLTPIWLASYGCCGRKIVGLGDDGVFALEDDE